MGKKYFYFIKGLPMEEIYAQTVTFWQNNKGIVEEESLSPDNLIKTLKIHRGISLTSNGEDYIIDFSYNLRDSNTYIRIQALLALGYGIQWLTPKKLINKWVSELKITPTYLVGRSNEEFFDFDKIQIPRSLPVERSKSIAQLKIKSQAKFESQPKPVLWSEKNTISQPSVMIEPPGSSTMTSKTVQKKEFEGFYEYAKIKSQAEKTTISQPSVMIKPPESSTMTSKTVQKKEFDRFDEFAVKFCTFCGFENKKTFNFCKNCGRKFD